MKLIVNLFSFFLLCFPAVAQNPETDLDADTGFVPVRSLGIKGGVNLVNYSSMEISTAYLGFHAGILGGLQVSKAFGFGGEILYSRHGTPTYLEEVGLNYVSLPVMLAVHGGPVVFQAGLFGSYLISAKAKGLDGEKDYTEYFERIDYGFMVGLNFSPSGSTFFGARLNLGLVNINKGLPYPSPYNTTKNRNEMETRNIQLTGGYKF